MLRISFGEYGSQDNKGLDAILDHEYALADVDAAMRMSMSPESLKVVMTPNGPVTGA